jgi:hypothetical protein
VKQGILKILQAMAIQIFGMVVPILVGLILFRDVFLSHDHLLVALQTHPVGLPLLVAFMVIWSGCCGWIAGKLYRG